MMSSNGPSPPASTMVNPSTVTDNSTVPTSAAYANFTAAQTNAAPSMQAQGKDTAWSSRMPKQEENTSFMEELLYGNSPAALAAKRNNYGLLGILKVIRMTDPGLNLLALGTDLTTLGLNLNAPDSLFSTFGSPCADPFTPQQDQDYNLPACYNLPNTLSWSPPLQKVEVETLFYIFYNMTRDLLQVYAATELYNRKWIYHKKNQKWFFLLPNEPHASFGSSGTQRWHFFDPVSWMQRVYVGEIELGEFLTGDEIKSIQEDGLEQVRQHQQVYTTVSRTSSSTPVLQSHNPASPPNVHSTEMKSAITKEEGSSASLEMSSSHSLTTDKYAS